MENTKTFFISFLFLNKVKRNASISSNSTVEIIPVKVLGKKKQKVPARTLKSLDIFRKAKCRAK